MNAQIKSLFTPIISLCVTTVIIAISAIPSFDRFHGIDIDLLQYFDNQIDFGDQAYLDSPVVVIAIDETTYATKPFSGLPKVMWTPQIAQVQNAILDAGAKVIGWDIILPTSAASYVEDKNFDKALLKSLARARKDNQIILGTTQLGNSNITPNRLFTWAAGGISNLRSLNVNVDDDGIVRSLPTFITVQKRDGSLAQIPSFSLEMASRYKGIVPQYQRDGPVLFNDLPVSGSKKGKLQLNHLAGNDHIPTYSLADLYACSQLNKASFFEEHFRNRIVLLGLVLDIEDRKLSSNRWATNGGPPFSEPRCTDKVAVHNSKVRRETVPGVYIHATAINNIINNSGLEQPGTWTRLGLAFILSLIILITSYRFSPGRAALTFLAVVTGWIALALWQVKFDFVLPLVDPVLSAFLTFVFVLGLRFTVIDKDRRFLKRAFSSYVAPELVETLLANPDKLKLGGERKELSFLFTDLANFTSMVENMEPAQIATLLNDYLDKMIEIAKANSGTIDKVIGDAIVVIFSAPVDQSNHAKNALNCARKMDVFAENYAKSQRKKGIMFGSTRIGVHSGTAVVGNFGSSSFFDYTALGDSMNIAARLENANKRFGTRVLVSDQAIEKSNSVGRSVGHLLLKGKSNAIQVFDISKSKKGEYSPNQEYQKIYNLIQSQDPLALNQIKKLCAKYPNDPLLGYYLNRLKAKKLGTLVQMTEK